MFLNYLYESHAFAFGDDHLIGRFPSLQGDLGFFRVTLELLARGLGLLYRWRNGTHLSEEICLLCKTLRWGVLYLLSNIFFYLNMGKKPSYLTKEEL